MTQPARPEQDWNDYLSVTGRRSAKVEVDVMSAALEDSGKAELRLRW